MYNTYFAVIKDITIIFARTNLSLLGIYFLPEPPPELDCGDCGDCGDMVVPVIGPYYDPEGLVGEEVPPDAVVVAVEEVPPVVVSLF